ncbi:PIG-L deacetylase family protein [Aurantimonas sp. A2-1-M11]|uniref:PIG-L deacetylase family protein n=1 Tax=Aurantimonas sp. A2-1-M11 TaxID=3113712 RepID=UPI002F942F88
MSQARDPRMLAARNILIVAPHADDESLGCGGLAAILARDGRHFHTLFVTDGGASHRNSPTWPRPALAAKRLQEAEDALAILGLGVMPRSFLDLPDADLPEEGSSGWDAALGVIRAVAAGFGPDLVLLPWRRDPHSDHRAAWHLVTQALALEGLTPDRLEYAIWLDELGAADDHPRPGEMRRVSFDIAAAVETKRAAVAAHLSQTTALIDDDPDGFRLDETTIARLTGPIESYWQDGQAD